MNTPDLSLFDRRRRVGWTAFICVGMAVVGFATEGKDCVWGAAAMRIGFVLGSLWLCFPTKTRPAAWAVLTQGRLVFLVIGRSVLGPNQIAAALLGHRRDCALVHSTAGEAGMSLSRIPLTKLLECSVPNSRAISIDSSMTTATGVPMRVIS